MLAPSVVDRNGTHNRRLQSQTVAPWSAEDAFVPGLRPSPRVLQRPNHSRAAQPTSVMAAELSNGPPGMTYFLVYVHGTCAGL